jgi:NAD(P)-dependent dehydrogenase (short-subunit alcohol dehydrogenase family)
MELEGKTAIVTGAGVRLGRAMALAMAERGARLVVHYNRSAGPAQEVVGQIEALGGEALAVQADLSQPRQAPSIVERAVECFGRVDVLVNNAAIFEPGSWDDTTEEHWDRHFDINLKSPFFLLQAFARQVVAGRQVGEGQRAHIVNIADWRGARPGADYVAYTLTKAALIALTQSMAQALGPKIQVNAILPGLILPLAGHGPEGITREAAKIPARRTGSAAEIAKALLYLLDADFVTGELLHVTGGEHLLAGRG